MMAIAFSATQMQQCDAIAVEDWYGDLRDFLQDAFPAVPGAQLDDWCKLCRATCERLEIRSEQGIYAFHILCLRAGQLISAEQDYIDQHIAYKRKFGSADTLPIDLLAWVRACGA